MHTLPGKLVHVYVANLMAKPANLPKFMIVTYASGSQTCILYKREDELYTLEYGCPILMQSEELNSYPTT